MSSYAAAGHELRTPLARMRTELELALRSGCLAAEVRVRLTDVLAGVDQLTRVIRELLVLARDDEGHLLVRPSVQEVGSIVAAELSTFRLRAQQAGVFLVLDVEPGIAAAIDEVWIRHALDNLLDNALRQTPAGASVEVVVRAAGDEAVVEVSDRGPGFPSELLERAFDRSQGRAAAHGSDGNDSGTGLGLWIVWMIMVAHNGRAELSNRSEGGAVVSLRLPRVPPEPGPPLAGMPEIVGR